MGDYFSEEHTQMWLDSVKEKSYYELKVPNGTYSSDNIFSLMWEVLTHRTWHLFKHGRWMD
jgi:hypothetical protein|tara:strand:- start:356 stop:538 length:183 start_codon:yes stop_codon:yes gene_type:complete